MIEDWDLERINVTQIQFEIKVSELNQDNLKQVKKLYLHQLVNHSTLISIQINHQYVHMLQYQIQIKIKVYQRTDHNNKFEVIS